MSVPTPLHPTSPCTRLGHAAPLPVLPHCSLPPTPTPTPTLQGRRYQDYRREMQDIAAEQVRRQLRAVQKGGQGGDSVTELGYQVMEEAHIQRLVTVTERDRAAAQLWVQRAGHVGQQVLEACKPTSRLGEKGASKRKAMPQKRLRRCEEQQEGVQEKQQLGQRQEGEQGEQGQLGEQQEEGELGVQGLFSRLIQKSPGLFHVHDVHRTKSVCLDMKPDCVVSCTAHCMPIDTVLILDLKGQSESRKEYCRASHIYQVWSQAMRVCPDCLDGRLLMGLCQPVRLLHQLKLTVPAMMSGCCVVGRSWHAMA